jgi:nitroreductase
MQKPAQTEYPIHDWIAARWSPVGFVDDPIDPAQVRSLLEAARWAASCFNEQPWSFIVAHREDAEEFERLLGCLVEGNRVWARRAPLLVLSVAKMTFDRNGRANRWALHDVGLAVANLTLQATALGLSVHQMGGIEVERAREVYGIPDGHEPVAGIAVGRASDPDGLPDQLRARQTAPRSRKPQSTFAFRGTWGRPL